MEFASEIPLLEPVLVVLWSDMLCYLTDCRPNSESRAHSCKVVLLFIKTMFLFHVFGNVSDGDFLHDIEAENFPPVEFPLVPLGMSHDGLRSRHYFSVTQVLTRKRMEERMKDEPEFHRQNAASNGLWVQVEGDEGFLVSR